MTGLPSDRTLVDDDECLRFDPPAAVVFNCLGTLICHAHLQEAKMA